MIYKFFIAALLFFTVIQASWAHPPEECKPEELKKNKNQTQNPDKNSQNKTKTDETKNPDKNSETETKTNEIKMTTPPKNPILAILINEFMPDPEGSDDENEWIELKNPFQTETVLDGWKLDDNEGGSKPFTLDGLKIGPESFLLLKSPQTKIALNNGNDSVRLFAYDGIIIDQVSYENPDTGKSFARTRENNWMKNEKPTPGNENIFDPPKTESTANENSDSNKKETEKTLLEPPKGDMSEEIEISEILPNPAGPDKGNEWIELRNNSDEKVNLSGWKIATKTKKFTIPENFIIQPNGYMTLDFNDIGLTLKNNGNEIYLLDPADNEIDAIEYDKAGENISFSKISIIKTGEKNVIPVASAKSQEELQEWQWTEETTKGKMNPLYYEMDGTVGSEIAKNHFLFKARDTELKIEFDGTFIAAAISPGSAIKILAKKREKNEYELKSLEILETPEKINTAKTTTDINEQKKSYWPEAVMILITVLAGSGYFLYRYLTKLML